ncbi:MAG: SDR family oxidoreductase [Woronichinia naegeliana WA131]|uniref:SDR family oxidoreductase n=1 Tax=Woronichinia naegeliana WA131 TaxID=2824559 RepID=A0A977PUG7_9CYAN|nr:MAG: SDR family oxidoreductase [Woronichinia naegeliana WA131]
MNSFQNGQAKRLQGQVAIVTGGAGGIGQAACQGLMAEGASVVIVDKSTERIEQLQQELAQIGGEGCPETLGLTLDVRKEEDMEAMARLTVEKFGQIDILVTSAAVLRGAGSLPKPMVKYGVDEWDFVMDINLKGVFLSNRAVLPNMIQQKRGTIINMSSVSGRQGRAHDSAYCATKFGVIGFSESVAEEVRQYGIKVQVVLPDAVDTPIWEQNGPIRPEISLPPERVGNLIVYLVCLPPDTIISAPIITPFQTRKRRGAKQE